MSTQPRPTRRTFLAGAGASLAAVKLAHGGDEEPKLTHGPFRGDRGGLQFDVWARVSAPGEYVLRIDDPWDIVTTNTVHTTEKAQATEENDLTLNWTVGGLSGPHVSYQVRIEHEGKALWSTDDWYPYGQDWHTYPRVLVFGSCADDRKLSDQLVWSRIRESKPSAIVLIGDTPYIDTTELEVQRRRYREFFAQPQMAETLRAVPFYATWDDHDYAGNDLFGDVKGREQSRRAFLEYHPPGDYGENGQGIYSSFRRGSTEVFLLDTRWFADVDASPFDATKKSLLGAAQWTWLQKQLLASTATFKLLVCGMIWNGALGASKRDCWNTWPHERDGLFAWLGEKKISGVVLIGGDLHRSRALRHPTKALAGYDIVELITSPLASNAAEATKSDDPALLFDKGVEQSFLRLTSESKPTGPRLLAQFINADGSVLYQLELDSSTLRAKN